MIIIHYNGVGYYYTDYTRGGTLSKTYSTVARLRKYHKWQ